MNDVSYAAQLGADNRVIGVTVVPFMQSDDDLDTFMQSLSLKGRWVLTAKDGSFRSRYAGVGYLFDEQRDEFVPPEYELIEGEWTAPPLQEPVADAESSA